MREAIRWQSVSMSQILSFLTKALRSFSQGGSHFLFGFICVWLFGGVSGMMISGLVSFLHFPFLSIFFECLTNFSRVSCVSVQPPFSVILLSLSLISCFRMASFCFRYLSSVIFLDETSAANLRCLISRTPSGQCRLSLVRSCSSPCSMKLCLCWRKKSSPCLWECTNIRHLTFEWVCAGWCEALLLLL